MTPLADNGPDVSAVASVDGAFSPLGRGGNGRGNHGGAPGAHDDAHGPDHPGRSHEAKVVGFVTAKGAEALTVEGITIEIEATTLIRHGNRTLTIDDIEIGDHVQARGMMNEDETILTAIEVKVEDTGNDNEDDDAELRGTVAGLPGPTPCPNLTFTIGGTTVKTNIDTSYEGVTCAALANGNIVEVEGETQADGSVRAEDVELEAGPDEVEGKISGLPASPSCPNVTFTVGTTTVQTNNLTTYGTGLACASLANNMKVEVEGTLSGTTLTAASIELK